MQFIYPQDDGEKIIDFSNSTNKKVDQIKDCFKYPLNINL